MIRKATYLIAGIMVGAVATAGITQPQLFSGSAAIAASTDTYRNLNLFGDIFERVRSDYVEVPEDKKLVEDAINGMLSGLDPHSSFLNADSFKDMQVQTSGKFGGLGIEVTMEEGILKVIAPMDGTPAAKAGVLANDKIVALDGESISGVTLSDAVDKMRGAIGTSITLTIERDGAEKPIDIKIVRAEITVQAVKSRREGDVGYIRVSSFSEQTFDGVRNAIEKLTAEIGADKVQGWIVDLRNNPGGLLDQSIAVSDAFLDKGEIVSTRTRRVNEMQRYNARSGDLTNGKPVIVLVNGGSASASEIVAGALQDHRRATIVGTRSFGKGSVQTIIPLGAEGALRLTTARYYTPSGKSIQAKGIEPDIEVIQELPPELAAQIKDPPKGEADLEGALSGEDEEAGHGSLAYVPPDPKDDKQLNFALDLLRGLQANSAFPPDPNQGIPN
jgi:carboxyl-terminal processing protease